MSYVLDTRKAPLRVEMFFTYLPVMYACMGELVYAWTDTPELWLSHTLVENRIVTSEAEIGDHPVITFCDSIKKTLYMADVPVGDPWLPMPIRAVNTITFTRSLGDSSAAANFKGDFRRPFSLPKATDFVAVHYNANVDIKWMRGVLDACVARGCTLLQTGKYAGGNPGLDCQYDLRDCTSVPEWVELLRHCKVLLTDSETAAVAALNAGTPVVMVLPPREIASTLLSVRTTLPEIVDEVCRLRNW